jgi:hypothetical protein
LGELASQAREQEAMKREIAALGRQLGEEAAARGKFVQELGSLKAQFGEERAKWDEANKQHLREHESLRKQNGAPPPATQGKPAPAPKPPDAPAKPKAPEEPKKPGLFASTETKQKYQSDMAPYQREMKRYEAWDSAAAQWQFPFTSDPPEQGKKPAGGVISHLTAKWDGNVYDKGIVKITASSVYNNSPSCAPRNAADRESASFFFSQSKPGQWICWDSRRSGSSQFTTRSGRPLETGIGVI